VTSSVQSSPKKKVDKRTELCIIGITLKKEVMALGQRVGFYLTDLQIQTLKKVSKKTGLTVSEIIRRAVDGYLEKFERKARVKA
jgi:aspartate/methionine/tyrosine aminotransferase